MTQTRTCPACPPHAPNPDPCPHGICPQCALRLDRDLAWVLSRYQALAHMTPARSNGFAGERVTASTVPDRIAERLVTFLDAREAVTPLLTSWAETIAEVRGETLPPTWSIGWLRDPDRHDWACRQDFAADYHAEITAWSARARRLLPHHYALVLMPGWCPRCGQDTLWWDQTSHQVECTDPEHGQIWTQTEYLRLHAQAKAARATYGLDEPDDPPASGLYLEPETIATTALTINQAAYVCHVRPKTIYAWINAGRIEYWSGGLRAVDVLAAARTRRPRGRPRAA